MMTFHAQQKFAGPAPSSSARRADGPTRGPVWSSPRWRAFAAALGLFAAPGCGGGSSEQCSQDGVEGCPCTAQGLCLGGLQCLSNHCVVPPSSGTADPTDASQSTAEPTGGDATGSGGELECAMGLTRCAGECVDVQGHPQHCGECDNACPDGGVCIDGDCAAPVDCSKEPCPGFTYCDQASKKCLPGCEFNPQCGTGAKCDASTHECVCNPGFHMCGGACVLDSDATKCGASCQACPAVENGEPACVDGACGAICNQYYVECGGKCYDEYEQVICESNRPTCTVCPNAMGEPDPACDDNDQCTYECFATGHIPCGDLECKVKEGSFCSTTEECCQMNGPLVCKTLSEFDKRCVKP